MEEWKKEYPSLFYKEYLFTKGRIIILDQEIPQETQAKILSLKTKETTETIFLRSQEMAIDLEVLLEKELFGLLTKEDTLFVFPGHGATKIRELSVIHKNHQQVEVLAKRFWKPGSEPVAIVGKITLPKGISERNIKTMIVLDDVISSGKTLFKLYEKNSQRFKATWIAGCWVSQVPRMKETNSGVIGYSKIITAIVVEGPQGKKVPINSLSTFINETEIAKSYAERHLQEPHQFLALLREIKTLEN